MRKLVYGMAVSLDGFMEGPNGEYDWIAPNPGASADEYIKPFDTFLIGRKSYEKMLSFGGNYSIPGIRNVVVSHSLHKTRNEFDLLNGDSVGEIKKMKAEEGKDIALYGGAELASSLFSAGLIDEVVLSLQPVLLGAGKSMFLNLKEKIGLKLLKSKTTSSVVVLHYQLKN